MAQAPSYAPNVVNQTVFNDGMTWKGNPGTGWSPVGGDSSSGGGNVDIIGNAQKLLDFQKKANEPVVAQLQTQQPGLDQKYKDLVASIKGNQTVTTNNELGRRGISGDSGVAQQEITSALTPIDAQYAGLTANATAGSISDTQALAREIAGLQAGNPETAISGAGNWAGLQNQASQIASQNALNTAQSGFYSDQGGYYTALAKSLTGGNIPLAEKLRQQFGL